MQTSELIPTAAAGQPAPSPGRPTKPLGMWDDELARPRLSLAVLLAWLALVAWLCDLHPWGFAQ